MYFLGFHSFGLYIHNDTMSALGRPQDMFSDTAFSLCLHNGFNTSQSAELTAPNALSATSLTW
jgi:photosystem I P700 chlorophyll a apoprotein A1